MTSEELQVRVETALEEIRPCVKSDGGDMSLVSIDEGKKVTIKFEGACTSCTINQMTLKSGVEMTIKKHAPQIEEVVNVA